MSILNFLLRHARRYVILLVVKLVLIGVVLFVFIKLEEPNWEFRDASRSIHAAIEQYAVDHDGNYPADLATLVQEDYLAMPENPYANGDLVIQSPGDEPVRGGIVYIVDGPVIAGNAHIGGEPSREYDSYTLICYGKKKYDPGESQKYLMGRTPQKGVNWERAAHIYRDMPSKRKKQ